MARPRRRGTCPRSSTRVLPAGMHACTPAFHTLLSGSKDARTLAFSNLQTCPSRRTMSTRHSCSPLSSGGPFAWGVGAHAPWQQASPQTRFAAATCRTSLSGSKDTRTLAVSNLQPCPSRRRMPGSHSCKSLSREELLHVLCWPVAHAQLAAISLPSAKGAPERRLTVWPTWPTCPPNRRCGRAMLQWCAYAGRRMRRSG